MRITLRSGLPLILWLVALHSLLVGVGLIFLPDSIVQVLGFAPSEERFFRTQGGVFHIVMTVAYALAAMSTERFRVLVWWAVAVKFMATVFLLVYYGLMETSWVVLASGVGDCLMGVMILLAQWFHRRGDVDGPVPAAGEN